jgi:ABC-type Fe3+/spermidine/putrescine transport system ATPase subunit
VALARSAAAEPKLLLLDEPLSNLDAKLREQMRNELRQLVKQLDITTVHITHDQSEAMAIADRIIYMNKGRIEQEGTPRELYRAPATRSVAEFVGSATFLEGSSVRGDGNGLMLVAVSDGLQIWSKCRGAHAPATPVTIALRPEQIRLSAEPLAGPNVFPGEIRDEVFLGDHTEYTVTVGATPLKVRTTEDFAPGSRVSVSINPEAVISFAPPSSQAEAGSAMLAGSK